MSISFYETKDRLSKKFPYRSTSYAILCRNDLIIIDIGWYLFIKDDRYIRSLWPILSHLRFNWFDDSRLCTTELFCYYQRDEVFCYLGYLSILYTNWNLYLYNSGIFRHIYTNTPTYQTWHIKKSIHKNELIFIL